MKRDERVTSDMEERAREFAVNAHTRIGHLRKYHKLPYATHLHNVAALVASVTDDPETLAAAWLHDVVEDTPATLEDVEKSFGRSIASLVESLTDVSRPRDGNRSVRKELDRRHLAKANRQAKTIKLADLIDNCRDICQNDARFAQVYLAEHRLLHIWAAIKVLQTQADKCALELIPVGIPLFLDCRAIRCFCLDEIAT